MVHLSSISIIAIDFNNVLALGHGLIMRYNHKDVDIVEQKTMFKIVITPIL